MKDPALVTTSPISYCAIFLYQAQIVRMLQWLGTSKDGSLHLKMMKYKKVHPVLLHFSNTFIFLILCDHPFEHHGDDLPDCSCCRVVGDVVFSEVKTEAQHDSLDVKQETRHMRNDTVPGMLENDFFA